MDGQLDIITLISLVVAAIAVWKLRSVLGQRTEDDTKRVERLRAREREAQKAAGAGGDVVSMPQRERETVPSAPAAEPQPEASEAAARAYQTNDPTVTEGLLAIAKQDTAFTPEAFLSGASMAYEMIVTAFADGNKKALKELLSRDVYEAFMAAIAEREKQGDKIDQQFVGIKRSDIVDAETRGGVAAVTVRFVSELITARRDAKGEVIDGDPQKIKDVTDIWTFTRDISSARVRANPNWKLDATQPSN